MDKLVLNDFPITMTTKEIMEDFEGQLKIDNGLELTSQQRVEIIRLLCKHPILKVMCESLENYGYDNA